MHRRRRADSGPHPRTLSVVAATCLLALVLAACGSQVDPSTVAAVGGIGSGVQGSGVTADSSGGSTDQATGGDTGTTTGGSTGGSTTGSTSGSTGGSTGGKGGGSGTSTGQDDNAATGGAKQASCEGFKNGPGITDDKIVIGNASDISGPVPGLFESSQEAVQAYVAYFNATTPEGICGRKLELKIYDTRTDAGADQQAAADGCDNVFAMVGSMSGFDSGGAETTERCGMPDIRSASVTSQRSACTTCFGTQSTNAAEFENAVPDFIMKNYDGGQHAAMLYLNAGAAAENGRAQAALMTKRGMNFDYIQGIDTSEFNYAPYVQAMKDKGIETVQFVAAPPQLVRLAQTMKQQSFTPKLYLIDPTAYDPDFVDGGGAAVDGTVVFMNFTPFEEASRNEETRLYLDWLQRMKPGAEPGFFGVFSWSAARLFVEQAVKLGGNLSRAALVDAIRTVDGWTANGMHSGQRVGPKRVGDCWRFIRLDGGTWSPVGGTKYSCNGTTMSD